MQVAQRGWLWGFCNSFDCCKHQSSSSCSNSNSKLLLLQRVRMKTAQITCYCTTGEQSWAPTDKKSHPTLSIFIPLVHISLLFLFTSIGKRVLEFHHQIYSHHQWRMPHFLESFCACKKKKKPIGVKKKTKTKKPTKKNPQNPKRKPCKP